MSKLLKTSGRKMDECQEISTKFFDFPIDPQRLIFKNKNLCFLFRDMLWKVVFEP